MRQQIQEDTIRSGITTQPHCKLLLLNMRPDVTAGPIMIRNDNDLPYMNNVLMAHRAKNIVYRRGPARKVQLVVPSASPPSPQSAVIRTLRPARSNSEAASSKLATRGRREGTDSEAVWRLQRQVLLNYKRDRPRDLSLRAIGFNRRDSKETHHGNDDGKALAPAVLRIHRGFSAADFEDSEDEEDSLCDDSDIEGLDLKATTYWSNCNWKPPQEHRLTSSQLRILENVLRETVAQALAARRNGRPDSSIFSEEATRPFRPSGIRTVKAELSSCLEAFRQLRLRLLWENQGISMAEILERRSLDVRPR